MPPLELLKRAPLLRHVSLPKLRRILKITQMRSYPAGTTIFNKRDLGYHMFIVSKGRVKVFSKSGARKSKTFAYLGSGDFFGEMALLDTHERSASAEAVEDCELLVLHQRDFRGMLMKDPHLCYCILRTLSMRLRKANEQVEDLLFRNVLGRVSHTLCDLANSDGQPFRGGLLIKSRYSRQELADLVGTTREPLSRALASLQRAQLVKFHHGAIHLRNVLRMRSLAGLS